MLTRRSWAVNGWGTALQPIAVGTGLIACAGSTTFGLFTSPALECVTLVPTHASVGQEEKAT